MSRSSLPRPTLLPGLPRIWRSSHTLQIGLDPRHAVLLDLPDPGVARLLDLLDGTRSERAILREAAAKGVAVEEGRALLDSLRQAGFLIAGQDFLPPGLPATTRRRLAAEAAALALAPPKEDAPARVLRRRAAAKVSVSGRGRLGPPIAVALAEAGIGHIDCDVPGAVIEVDLPGGPLHPADLGLPRRAVIAAAVQRAAPGTVTRPIRRGTAALTIQLSYDQPAALLAASHASRSQPHLAVAIREGIAVIGPLVPAAGGPCLNCLDMHRRDRDPGWQGGAGRLNESGSGGAGEDIPEPCTIATLLAATAYATAEALTFLDGNDPETLGGTVEITAPGRFRRRSWSPHPGCGCAKRVRTAR